MIDYLKRRIGPDMITTLPENGNVLRKKPFPVKILKMFWKVDTITTENIPII